MSRRALTPKQAAVLALIAGGHNSRSAARALGMSEATARTHMSSVLTRLGVHSSTAAVSMALTLGYLTLGEIAWAKDCRPR